MIEEKIVGYVDNSNLDGWNKFGGMTLTFWKEKDNELQHKMVMLPTATHDSLVAENEKLKEYKADQHKILGGYCEEITALNARIAKLEKLLEAADKIIDTKDGGFRWKEECKCEDGFYMCEECTMTVSNASPGLGADAHFKDCPWVIWLEGGRNENNIRIWNCVQAK